MHKDFIIVPIDKAASNYAVLRKLFYTNKVTVELNNSKYYGKSKLGQNAITNKFNAYIKEVKNIYSHNFAINNHHSFLLLFLTP